MSTFQVELVSYHSYSTSMSCLTDILAGDAEAEVAAAVAAVTGSVTSAPAPSDTASNRRSTISGGIPPALASALLPLSDVLRRDPLAPLPQSDKAALWANRYALVAVPSVLPKFLRSVPWANREAVAETHALLSLWPPLPPEAALQVGPTNTSITHGVALNRCCSLQTLSHFHAPSI